MIGTVRKLARQVAIGALAALLAVLLAGCGADSPGNAASRPDQADVTGTEPSQTQPAPAAQAAGTSDQPGAAPALGSIDEWYNSEPLSLDQLTGRPVLLVFWADY